MALTGQRATPARWAIVGVLLMALGCSSTPPQIVDAEVLQGDVAVTDMGPTDSLPGDASTDAEPPADQLGTDVSDSQDGGSDADAPPQPPGVFTVSVSESCSAGTQECFAYVSAMGWSQRPPPEPIASSVVSGPCRLIRPAPPGWCDPPCLAGNVCDSATSSCKPYVPPVSAGNIEVTGMKSSCTLIPETQYYYYIPHFDPEPTTGELYDQGTTITAIAPGADVPAFTVQATGVAALDSPFPCPPTLTPGQPLTVTWTPQDSGTLSFFLGSGNHGSQFTYLSCEVEDKAGTFVVDGTLVSALLADGVPIWQWSLSRTQTTSEVFGDYQVDLTVTNQQGCRW